MILHAPEIMLRCLLCTLVIECGLAFLLGVRSRADQTVVALVNVVTNPLLVGLCLLARFLWGHNFYLAVTAGLELAAFLTEALFYRSLLKSGRNPFLLSAVLNAASYFGGVLLNRFIF